MLQAAGLWGDHPRAAQGGQPQMPVARWGRQPRPRWEACGPGPGGLGWRMPTQSARPVLGARGSAVLFWDRDRENSGLPPGEVGSSGWTSKTSQG